MINPGEIFVIDTLRGQTVCAVIPAEGFHYSITELKTGNILGTGTLEEVNEILKKLKANRLVTDENIDMLAERKAKEIMSKYVEDIFNDDGRQSYETLARKIVNRFTKIGIVSADNAKTQFMKVTEEFLLDCLNFAWGEIKDRKGEVKNGSFVKEEDLNVYSLKEPGYSAKDAINLLKIKRGDSRGKD